MAQILNNTYEVLEFIGKGGMSTVFKARHLRLNTIVAIKAVRKDQTIDLLAEVNILTRLNHPNLVRVLDIFDDDKLMYIVMDYVEGEDLQHIIRREKVIPEETVMEWFRTLADTMCYLHTRKPPIIYRDMKPANVIRQNDGTLKIIDFGISREYKAAATNDTTYIGTNGFAAPEQFGYAQTDARTDIYSLGMTMYYLATGKSPLAPPFGYTPARKLNPNISEKLEAILEKCIKDNPDERYQNDDELMDDLFDGVTEPTHRTGQTGGYTAQYTSRHNTGANTGTGYTRPVNDPVQQPAPRKMISGKMIGILVAAAAALIAGIFLFFPKGSSNTAPAAPSNDSISNAGTSAVQPEEPAETAPAGSSDEVSDDPAADAPTAVSAGDTIKFGLYEQDNNSENGKEEIEWIVLANDGDRVLVISKYALDCQQYNTTYTDVTWETCSLREWLNGTFLETAFSESERDMIPSVTVSADRNPQYRTNPGYDTTDQVFLLSILEANLYFSSDSAGQCRGTLYCYAQGAYEDTNGDCRWWVRSPGDHSNRAASIDYDGYAYCFGDIVNHERIAVRPALWIDLGS